MALKEIPPDGLWASSEQDAKFVASARYIRPMKRAEMKADLNIAVALIELAAMATAAFADVNSRMIATPQRVAAVQQQLISALQKNVAQFGGAVVSSGSDISGRFQYWPIEEAAGATGISAPRSSTRAPSRSGRPAISSRGPINVVQTTTYGISAKTASCVYRGKTYPEGATIYGDPCPGQRCEAVSGPLLTCRGTQWLNADGTSVCSVYRALIASSLWNVMPASIRRAQARYYRSLGCR